VDLVKAAFDEAEWPHVTEEMIRHVWKGQKRPRLEEDIQLLDLAASNFQLGPED